MIGKEYMGVNVCSICISSAGPHEGNMQMNIQFNTQEAQNRLTP